MKSQRMIRYGFLTAALALAAGVCGAGERHSPAPAESAPTGLLCDLQRGGASVALRDPHPRFSWIVNASGNEQRQAAYEIRVATALADLTDKRHSLWDSGKTASDRSTAVTYAGPALQSEQDYWWQVRTWVRGGRAGSWSAPQGFHTGSLRDPSQAAGENRIPVERSPIEQREVAPVRMVPLEPGHYFLDFGRDAFAGLRIRLGGANAEKKLVVHLGEALSAPDRINRKPGGSIRYLRSEVGLANGPHTYTVTLGPKDGRRMSDEVGPVMPFRYVEIEGCPAPLTADAVRQVAATYRWDDKASTFHCSDPQLNAVWDLCKYSIRATSYAGVYVDGDRERLPYEADAYINQLGHYCTDREYSLARYSAGYLMLHPTWPTEWILHAQPLAWTDYLYTGDPALLEAFYPELERRTLQSQERADGLVSTLRPAVAPALLTAIHAPPIRDIVDWPAAERDGFEMRPVNTVVNAWHYQSLVQQAEIAEATGHTDDATRLRRAAQRVLQAVNEKLWDASTSLYVDGEGSRHSSLHANMFPLAFGMVPPERIPKIAAFLRSRGMACSVYGAQYLLEALYRAGEAEHARELMTASGDRSWRHMVEDVGTTITLEAWDNEFKPNQDWNHAWGAAPANIIPRWLMGIRPLEPGFRKMVVEPQPGGLEEASVDLPTVRGTVHEEFHLAKGRFTVNLRLPANTSAQVRLPRTGEGRVSVDGKRRPAATEGNELVIDPLGSGEHVLVCE